MHRETQACLRPRDRFWDIPVPKIDSAFDNLFVPQPSWSLVQYEMSLNVGRISSMR
ncbi:hypothetical protein [Thiolapillus sp.]|uniref:hypothetical protein n=1 Tax=Thiolapillus sp. TaxID=2017437 RepID=UPI003AF9B3BB